MADESESKNCFESKGFNFCFWAKFIIGFPALAISGYVAALQFHQPMMQAVAFIGTVMLLVWGARKVDSIPVLQKKIYEPKDKL